MSTTFPKNQRDARGYRREEVDAFLARARTAYDLDPEVPATLNSAEIRHTSFTLAKDGYSTEHVDVALERLEDAFALREREIALARDGQDAWLARTRESAQVILNRLARPEGHRFDRVSRLASGYSVAEVDAFAAVLVGYFQDGRALSIERVRTVVFPAQRGGYSEEQVDVVLDSVVDVMLAVR